MLAGLFWELCLQSLSGCVRAHRIIGRRPLAHHRTQLHAIRCNAQTCHESRGTKPRADRAGLGVRSVAGAHSRRRRRICRPIELDIRYALAHPISKDFDARTDRLHHSQTESDGGSRTNNPLNRRCTGFVANESRNAAPIRKTPLHPPRIAGECGINLSSII